MASSSNALMKGTCLKIESPIGDAISRIRFAPKSNNLLISSWDSVLRLYDVDSSILRLEAPSEAALLDCCFQDDSAAFSVGSDSCIRRYDFHSGTHNIIGNHDDIATSVEYSEETQLFRQYMSFHCKNGANLWTLKSKCYSVFSSALAFAVESMSLCGLYLIVAVGTSINMYDIRNLERPVQEKKSYMDHQIGCVCSFPDCKGYAIGSIDGRVKLEFLNPSDANLMGYIFRCQPKSKDGRNHLVAVNDIVFHPFQYGAFITGDNDGYTIMWDAQSRKRRFELPRYPNSVASLSYNHRGQLLAVASSYTYQEANEIEDPPQIFIHNMDENYVGSFSAGSSGLNYAENQSQILYVTP
ncbi:hypothetical protein HHK36_024290 [Tetracentron sinense]|uniref:Mitotic checkpoint protein bub3 n=1 Tax=Tetracentron sinense TaxID=13715 RepID=A0A834YMJ1_TETSI|nr:hypothetical protein HHK36_024290 [Tetracentron sinense]